MTPPSGSPTFPTLAVVSGKGGTGKTTVAVNLALTAPFPVGLLDCDVEEPNSRLTLHPVMAKTRSVTRPLPEVLVDRCVACGDCIRACRFNAIAPTATVPYIVPELCESCGLCQRVCPQGAIVEAPQEVGMIEEGSRGTISFAEGLLHLGHTQGPTVIQALRQGAPRDRALILDGPPGAACPAIATLRGADYALFVVEPTLFGLHDLEVVAKAAAVLGVPGGLVINRDSGNGSILQPLAESLGLPLLATIPEERRYAEAGLQGQALVERFPETQVLFRSLWDRLLQELVRVAPRVEKVEAS